MNAQEAIEKIEEKVEKLQNDYDFWSTAIDDAITDDCFRLADFGREQLTEIERELFPLKIVLESAKLLHHPFRMIASHEIYKMANGEDAVRLLDINNNHFAFVKLEEAKAIGIEKGVDE